MASNNNSIIIQPWAAGTSYSTYDVTAGIVTGTLLSSYGPNYYSTVDNNVGNNPSGVFVYAINSYERDHDLATINLTFTGVCPSFARGSPYAITGLPDPSFDTTGMVLNASSGSPNSFQIQFVNPGPDSSTSSTTLGAVNCQNPAWTTGFFWSPSYSTQWEVQQAVITAQFEAGYSQRSTQGIASNTNIWSIAFNDRKDTEVKGMMAFVQDHAAVYSTYLLIPPNRLYNNPTIRYVLSSPKVNTKSYTLSDVQIVARQVQGTTITKQTVNSESQSLTPTALLTLVELDLTSIGNPSQFYFTDMTTSLYKPVVFNGTTYTPFPVQVKELGYDGQGSLVRPKLTVSNIGGFVSNLLLQNQDLVGATVSITRVFARFIDAVNWPNSVSPYTPDPTAAYAPEVFSINRKTEENQQQVSWEITSSFELDGRKLPNRVMLAQFCSWRYREAGTCGYSGPPISDVNGNLFSGPPYNISVLTNQGLWSPATGYNVGDYVTLYSSQQSLLGVPQVYVCLAANTNSSPFLMGTTFWIQDACPKTLAGCRSRFGAPLVLPFGGFGGLMRSPRIDAYSTNNT